MYADDGLASSPACGFMLQQLRRHNKAEQLKGRKITEYRIPEKYTWSEVEIRERNFEGEGEERIWEETAPWKDEKRADSEWTVSKGMMHANRTFNLWTDSSGNVYMEVNPKNPNQDPNSHERDEEKESNERYDRLRREKAERSGFWKSTPSGNGRTTREWKGQYYPWRRRYATYPETQKQKDPSGPTNRRGSRNRPTTRPKWQSTQELQWGGEYIEAYGTPQ